MHHPGTIANNAWGFDSRPSEKPSFADHFVVESLDIIKIFVQADLGISFVYEAAVQREVQEGTLRVIPLSDAGIFHDISFIYLRDSIYEQDMENLFAALSA